MANKLFPNKTQARQFFVWSSLAPLVFYALAVSFLFYSGQKYFMYVCLPSGFLGSLIKQLTPVVLLAGAIIGAGLAIFNLFYGIDKRYLFALLTYLAGIVLLFFFFAASPPLSFDDISGKTNGPRYKACGPAI